MAQSAFDTAQPVVSESAAAIDRHHLARMTFGDRSLEHEVLQLFDRQATLLIERMRAVNGAGASPVIGALAHTLKGSAAGIGAAQVARIAAEAERVAADPAGDTPGELSATIDRLALAVDEARALIAELLRQG